jgi:hypothetical protein
VVCHEDRAVCDTCVQCGRRRRRSRLSCVVCVGRGGARETGDRRHHTRTKMKSTDDHQRAAQSRPNTSGSRNHGRNLPSVCPKKHATCTYENTHTYPEPKASRRREPRRGHDTDTRQFRRDHARRARDTKDRSLLYTCMYSGVRTHIRKGSRVPARRSAARGRVCACGRETGTERDREIRRETKLITVAVTCIAAHAHPQRHAHDEANEATQFIGSTTRGASPAHRRPTTDH